ncbi:MAG TPA: hypothetical protein VK735_39530 [Pseudonocardia sp.]|uniref:hypothetical protein n=1 Tax=Pseudonocardia sp. TaxID=60912 RepID=UPI002BEB90C7|nr:hypothetical protein [Pseudonocardia sp.]HTF53574.1 hypothetical protein [Pseudonocardia sp.]
MFHRDGTRDSRYSVEIEYAGRYEPADDPALRPGQEWVVRFAGERLGGAGDRGAAELLACQHAADRIAGIAGDDAPPVVAIVDIADVRPDATKVPVTELRAGDLVFDIWGGTHAVVSVRTLKDGTVSFRRDHENYRTHLARGGTITIVRTRADASN